MEKDMNKSKKIAIIAVIALIIIVGIIGGILIYLNKPTKYEEYKIIYNDLYIPGSQYEITINGSKIEVNQTHFCSALDCEPSTTKETFTYSKENTKKLYKFLESNFDSKNIVINRGDLQEDKQRIIDCLTYNEYLFELYIEEYKYSIEYSENDELGYHIYFKEDGRITVKEITIKDYDVIGLKDYEIKFKKENMNKLNNYFYSVFKKEDKNEIVKSNTLRKDEEKYYRSIIENNEKYLDEKDVKLLYTISYNGINCNTPTLYLYDDNTYEYFYTFGLGYTKLKPLTGTYNYDIKKIIDNIDKYEETPAGPYTIKDESGKTYITYDTNEELKEFKNELGLTLEKCLEQQ